MLSPDVTVALSARLNVNVEHWLESLRPGHGRVTISRRFVLHLISRLKPFAFASFCGRYQRVMLVIGMVRHPDGHTVKSGEVDSWPGHQGRQPGNDVQGRTNAAGAWMRRKG